MVKFLYNSYERNQAQPTDTYTKHSCWRICLSKIIPVCPINRELGHAHNVYDRKDSNKLPILLFIAAIWCRGPPRRPLFGPKRSNCRRYQITSSGHIPCVEKPYLITLVIVYLTEALLHNIRRLFTISREPKLSISPKIQENFRPITHKIRSKLKFLGSVKRVRLNFKYESSFGLGDTALS